ncbi:hypothetical protein B857_01609 [Solibacillus isronensis B3W22]|uniref:Uncharacterized protein n=1 Tax=Solibacillus isronensis B3W22 TaxID=1224748 RepID=K1L4Y8_9BACL|nr:hypothetical protein [Solibacillus isronensis]AMO86752.1 hypothetical protein SOLI23_14595 [Solibacillus silvestris]EKB45658.1 hypothetical protein B857_01609 [Solibacillus isronensis B3W22]MCM3722915.1 hypothetical protein [Solibacillus isronensis]
MRLLKSINNFLESKYMFLILGTLLAIVAIALYVRGLGGLSIFIASLFSISNLILFFYVNKYGFKNKK